MFTAVSQNRHFHNLELQTILLRWALEETARRKEMESGFSYNTHTQAYVVELNNRLLERNWLPDFPVRVLCKLQQKQQRRICLHIKFSCN